MDAEMVLKENLRLRRFSEQTLYLPFMGLGVSTSASPRRNLELDFGEET